MKALTELAGQTADIRIDAGKVDWRRSTGQFGWGKSRSHQCKAVKFALKVELAAVLPAVPGRAQGENDLA